MAHQGAVVPQEGSEGAVQAMLARRAGLSAFILRGKSLWPVFRKPMVLNVPMILALH